MNTEKKSFIKPIQSFGNHDGKYTLSNLNEAIKEYTLERIDSYVKHYCKTGNVLAFINNEIDLCERNLTEDLKHGIGVQIFQHMISKYKEYLAIKGLSNNIAHVSQLAFDNSTIANYFNDYKLTDFHKSELELVNQGYLDLLGKWIKGKKELVAFIYILVGKDYFKKKINTTFTKNSIIEIRKFIESRYKIDIYKQAQASQFDVTTDLKRYQKQFSFIS